MGEGRARVRAPRRLRDDRRLRGQRQESRGRGVPAVPRAHRDARDRPAQLREEGGELGAPADRQALARAACALPSRSPKSSPRPTTRRRAGSARMRSGSFPIRSRSRGSRSAASAARRLAEAPRATSRRSVRAGCSEDCSTPAPTSSSRPETARPRSRSRRGRPAAVRNHFTCSRVVFPSQVGEIGRKPDLQLGRIARRPFCFCA